VIDLRSDTVTMPTQEMRRAMAEAEVGDDVFGEDPTVNRLEDMAAELIGKEAALFVPTGTMGNQAAVLTHTSRGDEVLLDPESHITYYEVGAPAMFAGVHLRPVPGLLSSGAASVLSDAWRGPDIHMPDTRLICLENTFNRGGGTIMAPEAMREIYDMSAGRGIAVHVDGARIFNAAAAAGCDVKEFTRYCDSVMFCLSKGLCAPVGSILAGDKDFITRARKYRKALGGGMRQAGVLAAAGLEALKLVDRLHEDHINARVLAEGLAGLSGLKVDLEKVQTNIVVMDIEGTGMDSGAFLDELQKRGVRAVAFGPCLVRFVTHRDVSRDHVLQAAAACSEMLG